MSVLGCLYDYIDFLYCDLILLSHCGVIYVVCGLMFCVLMFCVFLVCALLVCGCRECKYKEFHLKIL